MAAARLVAGGLKPDRLVMTGTVGDDRIVGEFKIERGLDKSTCTSSRRSAKARQGVEVPASSD
jgi:hypothetical protein